MSQLDLDNKTPGDDAGDDDVLADLFDSLLQAILDGRTPDIAAYQRERPQLADRIAKTWSLACSVAGRREPSRPTFGGYEIVRELGHGGMGTVYLARHQTLQRDVAVKVLPQSLAMSPHAKQRFLEEARALAQLRHENVVHIHRVVDHTEMLAFEMEFIDGPSLQKVLVDLRQSEKPHSVESLARVIGVETTQLGTRSTVEWFVRLTIRVARALGEVHRRGLLHRDVKPANILLRKGGTPVLADFGLALQGDLDTRPRKFAGTPVYAAPERLRGDELHTDVRTDVYSLGVTLYEALTLTPPFQGTTTDEVLRRIENGRAPALRTRTSLVSRDLETIVNKAMETEPRHRYESADALADDLERLLNLQPILARPAGPLRRAVKFVRRHQKAAIASLCSAALVTAIAWPLAAMAANRESVTRAAERDRHAGRTELLGLDVMQVPWQPSNGSQPTQGQQVRREALQRAAQHYARACSVLPEDALLRHEAAAVEAATALASTDTPSGAEPEGKLSALAAKLTRLYLARRNQQGAAPSSSLPQTPETRTPEPQTPEIQTPEILFAAGLLAFLDGDTDTNRSLWRALPEPLHSDALVDACIALRHASEGAAAAAYPRVFHAARSFPDASALVVAMADGAAQAGDLELAHQWFAAIPVADDSLRDARRLLVAADILAAEGRVDEAQTEYCRLVAADASDPRALLHLARLFEQRGALDAAERVWNIAVTRWPRLHEPRLQLARQRLQRHDLDGYLALVRQAMLAAPGDTAGIAQLARLAGLRIPSHRDADARARHGPDALPLSTWLPQDRIRGLERALDVLPVLDHIQSLSTQIDRRPVGAALLSVMIGAMRFPDLTLQLPATVRWGIAALPMLLGRPTDELTERLLPYQRVLGDRVFKIEDRRLYSCSFSLQRHYYGLHVLHVGDLDGDTLDDLCVSVPPIGSSGGGSVELRSCVDGHLLGEWQADNQEVAFGRAITNLGDVDGDLCDDIVVGAPLLSMQSKELASASLRSGRTGEVLWRVNHEQASFGASMATLGDIDGDGTADVAIGLAPLNLTQVGCVWVCSGRTGQLLHELKASRTGTWFGAALCDADDLTGDGIHDLLVGGNYGGAPGLVAAFDGATGTVLFELHEPDPNLCYGACIAAIDDLDNDGCRDFAVSAPNVRGSSSEAGTVLLISGRTRHSLVELHGERPGERFGTRMVYVPGWRGQHEPALAISAHGGGPSNNGYVRVFDLRLAKPVQTMAGTPSLVLFGYSTALVGDRNGDGQPELAIMAIGASGPAPHAANAHCWFMSYADVVAQPR